VIRYPDVNSYLADKAKYGVITSQMYRFSRRCTVRSDFVYNTSLVIHRMLVKGYRWSTVWAYVRKFLGKFGEDMYDGPKVGIWVQRLRRKLHELQAGTIIPGPCGQVVVKT